MFILKTAEPTFWKIVRWRDRENNSQLYLSHALRHPLSSPQTPGLLPVWWERCQVETPLWSSCWTWVGSPASESDPDRGQWEKVPWPGLHSSFPDSLYLRAEAQAGPYAMIFLFIRTKRAQPTKGGRGSPLPFYLICSNLGLYTVTHRAFSKPHSSWHSFLVIFVECLHVQFLFIYVYILGFPGGASGKACQCRRCKRLRFDPWVGKMPWRRAWQPTPVFLSGESHGQRSLAGYSLLGLKESDTHTWYYCKHAPFM